MSRVAQLSVFVVLIAAGWIVVDQLRGGIWRLPMWRVSPHEEYARALEGANLHMTALGRAWLAAADRAISEPKRVALPFSAAHEFAAARPDALGFKFAVRRGQRIAVDVDAASTDAQLFLDLFELGNDGRTRRLQSAARADGTAGRHIMVYDVASDDTLVIRVQPELLRDLQVTIHHAAEATLRFPVEGANASAVGSVFGDPRDRGRRVHQGVDIFAPRGTPVIAVADGWVTGATTNRLGGNVVWIWDPSRGQVLYYAHLDRHEVASGQRVGAGDLIGLVGNSGNARTTPPHLHFGIYRPLEGAIDPLPFICDVPCPARGMAYAP